MGADIHVYVEHRNETNGQWECKRLYTKFDDKFTPVDVYEGRDYELFGLLGNVRGWTGPLVSLRGLPDDISKEVSDEYGDGDGYHSETWYDFCELEAYAYMFSQLKEAVVERDMYKKIAERNSDDKLIHDDYHDKSEVVNLSNSLSGFVNCISNVLDAYGIWYPKPYEVRVVMWFDS